MKRDPGQPSAPRGAGQDNTAPLTRLAALEQFGIKLGLDNIRTLVAAMGHPESAWRAVHIAGTNGKGSVTAMVETALRRAGHRTARYTSPHLDRLEERFEIDGEPVTSAQLEQVASDFFDIVDRLRANGGLTVLPTFFEATTAMAFELFRRGGVEVGVIEVGLGGRFDATNVLSPSVTAITSIDFDHERHLGRTLAEIAMEKAGIAKTGVPMIVGSVSVEAHASIAAVCNERRAQLIDAAHRVDVAVSMERGVASFRATTPTRPYPQVRLALRGRHQAANALVALRVLECCDEAGIAVGPDAIVAGLRDARWPARLEWLHIPAPLEGVPYEGSQRLLVDAAHNPAGARALADYLRDSGHAPLPIVLAVMQDKDVEGMLRAIVPVASSIVTTETSSARTMTAEALAATVARLAPDLAVRAEANPEMAVRLALTEGPAAVAAGSIYLIGPLRARLLEQGAQPK
jgi:dihydrofolate synthase/folylpolyglutamate synthase